MKKIFIHVGAGKTGTSAIQEFLRTNRDRIRESGIILPDEGLIDRGTIFAHHGLSDHGPYRAKNCMELWSDLSNREPSTLVVSSEDFHSKISEPDGLQFFEAIKSALIGWDVKIVFYIRRQSQWYQSAYQQWVKGNMEARPVDDHYKLYKKNPVDQLLQFAKVFGDQSMIVRPFERVQLAGGDAVGDFAQVIGLKLDPDFVIPRGNVNPRLVPDALELKRLVNGYAKGVKEVRHIRQDLLEYSAHDGGKHGSQIFSNHAILKKTQQLRIERDMEERYQEIARRFLGRDDGVLFRVDPEPDPSLPADAPPTESARGPDEASLFLIYSLYRRLDHLSEVVERLEARIWQLEKFTKSE